MNAFGEVGRVAAFTRARAAGVLCSPGRTCFFANRGVPRAAVVGMLFYCCDEVRLCVSWIRCVHSPFGMFLASALGVIWVVQCSAGLINEGRCTVEHKRFIARTGGS